MNIVSYDQMPQISANYYMNGYYENTLPSTFHSENKSLQNSSFQLQQQQQQIQMHNEERKLTLFNYF